MIDLTRNFDWTTTSLGARESWPVSLNITLENLLHSSFPMFLFWGEDLLCFYNDAFRPSLGVEGKHSAVGQPAREAWSDIWDFLEPLLLKVKKSGEAVWFEDQLVPFYRNGRVENIYWTFSYSPAYGDTGQIEGILVTCVETTEKVQQMVELKNSHQQFRTLIEEAPVASCLFVGREMKIEIANDRMIQAWGKTRAVLGMPLIEAVPELSGQPFLDILKNVYETGNQYTAESAPALLEVNGVLNQFYFNFTYTAVRDGEDKIYGVMDTAVDVTQQVYARQLLLQSENQLRNLILQAPVAICILRGNHFTIETANERMIELWGKSQQEVMGRPLFSAIPEAADQGFEPILEKVFVTGEIFRAQELPVRLLRDGKLQTIYINLVYQPYREEDGTITGIICTASEVTDQLHARQHIEDLVDRRTSDLAISTQELAAANEDLSHSNAELAQFAYIASHDLQEPLRKVATFTEILDRSIETDVPRARATMKKIFDAVIRMRALVSDILTMSQLSQPSDLIKPVDLAEVVVEVLDELEMSIRKQDAAINIQGLPVVEGVRFELRQLFINLIGNSLKFARKDVPVNIDIDSYIPTSLDGWAGGHVKSAADYVVIRIQDNGIGFEQQYSQKIFEIFQRLHGKGDYPGTGIGLAVCQKIVQRHHGSLRAFSEPGMGATFEIILPNVQPVL